MVKNLLMPGGLGFIGSHTIIQIFGSTDCNIIVVDDMSNCFDDVLDRIRQILSKHFSPEKISERLQLHHINILNLAELD